MTTKDDRNLEQVLAMIDGLDEPARSTLRRLHDVIVAAGPELKPRLWYGMPGYARSASSPVLVFFRKDDRISLGVSEKAPFRPAGGDDGRLMPAAWYLDELDAVTERRIATVVRNAIG